MHKNAPIKLKQIKCFSAFLFKKAYFQMIKRHNEK